VIENHHLGAQLFNLLADFLRLAMPMNKRASGLWRLPPMMPSTSALAECAKTGTH
jgi:hypothetical protein